MNYEDFLNLKSQASIEGGFEPVFMPDMAFDFQRHLIDWSVRHGRGAIFADCGLGKSLMALAWAENVVRNTNKPVLLLTPLAVAQQFVTEGEKFGVDCVRCRDGLKHGAKIVVTNYQRLHYFDPSDYGGVVCDESSILKNFDAKTKVAVTEFMRTVPFRLCDTATAAPNDYHELGTTSEALGHLGYRDMLTRFFKEEQKGGQHRWHLSKYRFRGHAENPFWRWVCSWARAIRKPSDLGYDDERFVLPELVEREHLIESSTPREGFLFSVPARDLREQREERRVTILERCEAVRDIVSDHASRNPDNPYSVVWCHLNDEAKMLREMIPSAVEVSGSMSDDQKEERLVGFQNGQFPVLITKPKIGCYGLNWQHCSNVVTFPSHSFEQYYQSVRRCWRFGQKNKVTVTVVTTEGEVGVLQNLQRKSRQAERMFRSLVQHMGDELRLGSVESYDNQETIPSWA